MLQIKRTDLNYINDLNNRILNEAVDISGFCGNDDPYVSLYDVVNSKCITFTYNPVGGKGYWPVCTFGVDIMERSEFDTMNSVEGQSELFGIDKEDIEVPHVMSLETILSSLQSFLKDVLVTMKDKKLEIIED